MKSYYQEKENIPILSLKRPSQTIKNNKQILKNIKNKLYPLNSVHRQDLQFKKLRKQANKKLDTFHFHLFNSQERNSLKLITKPNQNLVEPYVQNQMEIYKEFIKNNKSQKNKILKQNLEELRKKKSEQNQSMGNSQFKYQRLPQIQREVQLKKQQFIQKAKRQFMEVQFVDRDQRNYSFEYMVKKTEQYKKIPSNERSSTNVTVYEKYSPNKLKQYAARLKEDPHKHIKKNVHVALSRKLIKLPNSEEEEQQVKEQINKMKSKKSFKSLKSNKLLNTQCNLIQQNANKSTYTSKLRVTQNRKKFLDKEQDKKSRSIKYEPTTNGI